MRLKGSTANRSPSKAIHPEDFSVARSSLVKSGPAGEFEKMSNFYGALFHSMPVAFILLDRRGKILLWNPVAEKMFGYRSDEVIGLPLHDLIAPEKYGSSFARWIKPSASSRRITSIGPLEVEGITASGESLPIEVSIAKTRISDQPVSILVIRDIAHHKQTEEALTQARDLAEKRAAEIEAIYQGAPVGLCVIDRDLRHVRINERLAAMNGSPPEAHIGRKIKEMVPRVGRSLESLARHVLATGTSLLNKEISSEDLPSERKHYFLTSWFPLREVGGKIRGLNVVVQDITERKRSEEALRKSEEALRRLNESLEARVRERTAELERRNKELQDFAFVAAHDLQEPLRKIQLLGDMVVVKFGHCVGKCGSDYLTRIRTTAATMQELLRSLREYSLLTKTGGRGKATEITEAVHTALANLRIQIRESGAVTEIGKLPKIKADRAQMVHLFQNLISNALKYHRAGEPPRVKIHSRILPKHGERYEIYVEDNGMGFDEKYLDRIFLPFERLHGRAEYGGVGMGLAICKKIMERHRGAITARSSPGKGSTFILTFPEDEELPS